MRAGPIVLALLAVPTVLLAQTSISPAEAAQHVGETATVCGTVASATYAAHSKGRPTFLNLDRPYPDQVFTVLIWGSDSQSFPVAPVDAYAQKRICVTGRITLFKGVAEIVVRGPGAIRVVSQQGGSGEAAGALGVPGQAA
jgi:hypothetical protein